MTLFTFENILQRARTEEGDQLKRSLILQAGNNGGWESSGDSERGERRFNTHWIYILSSDDSICWGMRYER